MVMAIAEEMQRAQMGFTGLTDRDLDGYSLQRVIRMQLLEGSPGRIKPSGLEFEVHQELERHRPTQSKDRGGILVPSNIAGPDLRAARRAAELLGRAYPLDSV